MNSTDNIQQSSEETLSKKVVRGGVWIFSLRVINRSIGFIRTIILTSLLSPKDFGLIGIALLSMATLETFSQIGFQASLIQKKEDISPYLNTIWTVSAIRGLIISLILYFAAPLIADFFDSQESCLIIKVLALSAFITGLKNSGLVYFQKDLKFNRLFSYEFSITLFDFAVSLTLAFLLKNAWALVWATLLASLFRTAMSHIIIKHPVSVSIDWHRFRDVFAFGKWVFLSGIIIFLFVHGDDILVGKILGLSALGLYQMAYLISNLSATEITHVISQVSFPAYSRIQDDIPKLSGAYLKVLTVTALLSFPIAGITYSLSPSFIKIFMGDRWIPIIPAIQILCIYGLTRAIGATMGPILYSTGMPKVQAKLSGIQLALLILIIYPLTDKFGISGTSLSVVTAHMLGLILITAETRKILNFSIGTFLRHMSIPFLSTLITIIFLVLFEINFPLDRYPFIFAGTAVFSVMLYISSAYFFDSRKGIIRSYLNEILSNLGMLKI